MINNPGKKIIIYNSILIAGLFFLLNYYDSLVILILLSMSWLFLIFHFYFFRDPERLIPENQNIIVSPADGKVIKIDEVEENNYLHVKTTKVSIFMSIFNVHINRIPISGEVEYLRYKSGEFKAAFRDKSSESNEHSIIVIKSMWGKILFKQIAGFIARRIVTNLKEGEQVKLGDRFGMIIYGSRLDIFIPIGTTLYINVNDKVKAGETILGVFEDKMDD